jgi:hypothetical protein
MPYDPRSGHTLDSLAAALRGMPRHARIMVEMPDGSLRPVRMIRGIPSSPGHAGHLEAAMGIGGYTIALCLAAPEP